IREMQPYAKRIAHRGIWVEPKLLAEIEYRAKSAEGKVRPARGMLRHAKIEGAVFTDISPRCRTLPLQLRQHGGAGPLVEWGTAEGAGVFLQARLDDRADQARGQANGQMVHARRYLEIVRDAGPDRDVGGEAAGRQRRFERDHVGPGRAIDEEVRADRDVSDLLAVDLEVRRRARIDKG